MSSSIYVVIEDGDELGKPRLVGAYHSRTAALEACFHSVMPRSVHSVPIMDGSPIMRPRFDPICSDPFRPMPNSPLDPFKVDPFDPPLSIPNLNPQPFKIPPIMNDKKPKPFDF